jgi:hypothetical protein
MQLRQLWIAGEEVSISHTQVGMGFVLVEIGLERL